MFKIEINEKLIQWYLDNHMFNPDSFFCAKARDVLISTEKCDEVVQFSCEILEIINSLKCRKEILKEKISSKESQKIFAKIQNFFRIDASKKSIKIFLLIHFGEGTGGTFCRGDQPLIFLRISPDKKFSMNTVWHEYMHYAADLSIYFKTKCDKIVQKIIIPDHMKMGAGSIIEEGTIYVAEPLITGRRVIQSDVNIKKMGNYRSWGAFREQTVNNRKYLDLDDILNSIPEDWEKFKKVYESLSKN